MGFTPRVPLAPLTTLGVGGPAEWYTSVRTVDEVRTALAAAYARGLSVHVLGKGSNILVPDEGVAGLVIHMQIGGCAREERDGLVTLLAGAGTPWETIVDTAAAWGVYGVENLAGIPGSLGGAVVQNIGAYGSELADTFLYADCIDRNTLELRRVGRDEAAFGYRTSFFKSHPELIITQVALELQKSGVLCTAYPDVQKRVEAGTVLETPSEMVALIREIRAEKFPQSGGEGTAGSFFKNPVITREIADTLRAQYPEVPLFAQADGSVKVSLAWLLDHVLHLKGHAIGAVRVYERQPLVLVAQRGATASEVLALAEEIAASVLDVCDIHVEREVELFGVK